MSKKSFLSYYGGKKNMLQHILPIIPAHQIFTESFFGGGAVFFAKEPAESEIINDQNNLIVNFYQQVKNNFDALKSKVEATLFARSSYSVAMAIWRMPHLFSKLQQAWAFYVGCNMGFAAQIGSWGFDKYGKRVKAFLNKKMVFDESIVARLERTNIECNDACKVISTYDAPEAFHYVDPPYVTEGAKVHQGHYAGYSLTDYRLLLETLSAVEGKLLLSSYPSDILDEFILKNGWFSKEIIQTKTVVKGESGKERPKKIEVLTANYPI